MFAANTYVIRPATAEDRFTLRRWADRTRQQLLAGSLLIGEINGQPAAAISLLDGRTVAGPSIGTGHLLAQSADPGLVGVGLRGDAVAA